MGFIGGEQQAEFVSRIREASRDRLLAAPIDVGKHTAAMVCDFWGQVICPPFEFALNESGFTEFRTILARAEAGRDAAMLRVGLEQAGHYHDTLLARMQSEGLDVVVLNPCPGEGEPFAGSVEIAEERCTRSGCHGRAHHPRQGTHTFIRGWSFGPTDDPVAHRRRKVKARSALKNQVLATMDLVFPGFDGCFVDNLNSKFGRLLINETITPKRVMQMGASRLRS